MDKKIKQFKMYLLLLLFWVILNGHFDLQTLFYGSIFVIPIVIITYKTVFALGKDEFVLPSLWRFLWFSAIVLIAIVQSSIQHTWRIIKNESKYQTFEIEMSTNNVVYLTLIANAITLTPGTITLEIKGRVLKVVAAMNPDDDVQMIKTGILKFQKPFIK